MTPPWSRRLWAQPINRTFWPVCSARNSPHVWVRRRLPRKSSVTEGCSMAFSSCVSIRGFGEFGGDFVARQFQLLAGGHVLQSVAFGGDFVVADDEREARSNLVGGLHGAFELALA